MSIETVATSSQEASQSSRPMNASHGHVTPHNKPMAPSQSQCLAPPQPMGYASGGDVLLGDMSMMGGDVDAWTAPQRPQFVSQAPQYGFSCAPATLTRHTSMPSQYPHTPVQAAAPAYAMGVPPTLARHHSQSYITVLQQQQQQQQHQGFQAMMAVPPPRHVHVNEMQHLLEISMSHQQPMATPSHAAPRLVKPEAFTSSMNVEPIAFTSSSDTSNKLALLDDLDPLAYAVFGSGANTSKPLGAMPQDLQQIESAFDSLDRLLPEMESELLFRPAELDQFAQATLPASRSFQAAKTAGKSPKSMATCKVAGCARRVRSKGFCKTHGGGRKCSIAGCKKSSQNGDFCIGHGGGKKCKEPQCAKAAQSHGLCKAHGGGARCKYPDCNKSSQGGGLCRAHGGGKRCQAAGCPKGAQRGNFCATHGGFRNCKIDGCVRTDRGGGFCEVHRRGRLCKVDGCKKLSRNQGMCTMHIREDKQAGRGLSHEDAATATGELVV